MKIIIWVLIAVFSVLLGTGTLYYLVAPPLQMGNFLILTLLSLIILAALIVRYLRGWQILGSIALVLALFVASYLVNNHLYLSQEEHRELPEITRAVSDPGDGHTAILYFTHGEPQAYSPMPWIETFHELDSDGVSFIPKPFRALFITNLRKEYLMIGGSYHNMEHGQMIQSLINAMPEESAKGTRFYLAFLDSNPRPDEMAIRALNDGASKLIIMPVFLTISSHTKAGLEMVAEVDPAKYGVEVCEAEPLYNSLPLKQMFVARSNKHLGSTDKSKVGILLVGHGQPDDWDKIYGTQTEQENSFRQEVRQMLIADGYKPELVQMAWMEFKTPKIGEAVKELVAKGIEKIFVFPASISAYSIHSDIQIPLEVEEAGIPRGVEVVNMGAWGNDPYVIQAIREKIQACIP